MALIQVRMRYLEKLKDMSYSTVRDMPVFLNMDLSHPLGSCQLVITEDEEENEVFYGFLWLNGTVDANLYFYYLREAADQKCFCFAGINLSEKKMRNTNPRSRKVILMPHYQATISRNPKRLSDLAVGSILKGKR